MKTKPIETEVGVISGRDAFYLDDIAQDYAKVSVEFSGEINSNLCSAFPEQGMFLPYTLRFGQVIVFRQTELDLFEGPYDSSFFVVTDSSLVEQMRKRDHSKKLSAEHRHFILYTYDDVFDIVADKYELSIGKPKQQKA